MEEEEDSEESNNDLCVEHTDVREFAIKIVQSLGPDGLFTLAEEFKQKNALTLQQFTDLVKSYLAHHRFMSQNGNGNGVTLQTPPKPAVLKSLPYNLRTSQNPHTGLLRLKYPTKREEARLNKSITEVNRILEFLNTPKSGVSFGSRTDIEHYCAQLFAAIDHNYEDKISWEGFSAFLIDASFKGKLGECETALEEYMAYPCPHQPLMNIPPNTREVTFLPDVGKLLVLHRRQIYFVDAHTFKRCSLERTYTITPGHCEILSADFVPTLKLLVFSTSELQLVVWNTKKRKIGYTWTAGSSQVIIRWCPKYNRLYTGGRLGGLCIWEPMAIDLHRNVPSEVGADVSTKACLVASRTLHQASLTAICFMECHNQVATAGEDSRIIISDAFTAEIFKIFHHPNRFIGISCLTYCPQQEFLISNSAETQPFIWPVNVAHAEPYPLVDEANPPTHNLVAVLCIPDKPQLFSLDTDGYLKVWDLTHFTCTQTLACGRASKASQSQIDEVLLQERRLFPWQGLVLLADNSTVLTWTKKRFFVFKTATLIFEDETHKDDLSPAIANVLGNESPILTGVTADAHWPVFCITYLSGPHTWVTCTKLRLRLWNASTGAPGIHFESGFSTGDILDMTVDTNGRVCYLAGLEGKVIVVNLSNGNVTQHLQSAPEEITRLYYYSSSSEHLSFPRILLAQSFHGSLHILALSGSNTRVQWHPVVKLLNFEESDRNYIANLKCTNTDFNAEANLLLIASKHYVLAVQLASGRKLIMKVLGVAVLPTLSERVHTQVKYAHQDTKTNVLEHQNLLQRCNLVSTANSNITDNVSVTDNAGIPRSGSVASTLRAATGTSNEDEEVPSDQASIHHAVTAVQPEIVCVCSIPGLPAFAVLDAHNTVYIFSTRTTNCAFQCLVYWKIRQAVLVPSTVMTVCHIKNQYYLWAGDDLGNVYVYEVTQFLEKIFLHTSNAGSGDIVTDAKYWEMIATNDVIRHHRTWRPFTDAVRHINVVSRLGVVVATGEDGQVLMWSYDCRLVGCLDWRGRAARNVMTQSNIDRDASHRQEGEGDHETNAQQGATDTPKVDILTLDHKLQDTVDHNDQAAQRPASGINQQKLTTLQAYHDGTYDPKEGECGTPKSGERLGTPSSASSIEFVNNYAAVNNFRGLARVDDLKPRQADTLHDTQQTKDEKQASHNTTLIADVPRLHTGRSSLTPKRRQAKPDLNGTIDSIVTVITPPPGSSPVTTRGTKEVRTPQTTTHTDCVSVKPRVGSAYGERDDCVIEFALIPHLKKYFSLPKSSPIRRVQSVSGKRAASPSPSSKYITDNPNNKVINILNITRKEDETQGWQVPPDVSGRNTLTAKSSTSRGIVQPPRGLSRGSTMQSLTSQHSVPLEGLAGIGEHTHEYSYTPSETSDALAQEEVIIGIPAPPPKKVQYTPSGQLIGGIHKLNQHQSTVGALKSTRPGLDEVSLHQKQSQQRHKVLMQNWHSLNVDPKIRTMFELMAKTAGGKQTKMQLYVIKNGKKVERKFLQDQIKAKVFPQTLVEKMEDNPFPIELKPLAKTVPDCVMPDPYAVSSSERPANWKKHIGVFSGAAFSPTTFSQRYNRVPSLEVNTKGTLMQ